MKTIPLKHSFVNKIPIIDELFLTQNEHGYIVTINSFCKRIDLLADKYCDISGDPTEEERHNWSTFKGDCLEVLVEYLINTSSTDNRIGIYNYTPVNKTEDVGVDGFGIGENKRPATVQVKYRTGDYVLKQNADKLSNFVGGSVLNYGVSQEDNKNMLLITTGQDIHYEVMEKCFFNKVRVLNRDNLREMLDNKPMFWQGFWESMKQSRVEEKPVVKKSLRAHQQEAVEAIFG